MNFNVDRIAQLAGLSSAGGGSSSGTLNESAARRARPATTYDRVVEELQVRGLEMFYSPEQINEAIRSESRILAEERAMEMDEKKKKVCPSCGKSPCKCTDEGMEGEDLDELLSSAAEDEGMEDEGMHGMHAEDEGMAVGTVIRDPDGTEMRVTKGSSKAGTLAEAKLRKVISFEVDRVLAEMSNSGDTSWMYPERRRPSGANRRGATMGFAGVGFKR